MRTANISPPHQWSSRQFQKMFEILSSMPLAKTNIEIDDQVQTSFNNALKWMEEEYPSDEIFRICPSGLGSFKIETHDISISGTNGEFFFFGANGALEVRKQKPVQDKEIKDLLAMKYNFKQLYVCYAKLGADGCNVWGDDMFDRSY